MSQIERPTDEADVIHLVRDARARGRSLDLIGSGSKQRVGRPPQASATVSLRNLRGITLHEPTEMVISARAGTLLSVVEAELAKYNQQLAFEPIDAGPMLGEPGGQATVGGVIASNLSGSRRVLRGAARDHLLGVRFVNGHGEAIKAGGRVMKNVTGYDVCKALAGSWGTLGAMTEVTLRAVPKSEETRTLLMVGQPDEIAVEAMCAAMGTPYEVSGTLHLAAVFSQRLVTTATIAAGRPVTAIRIENFSKSVAYRIGALRAMFDPYGDLLELDHPASLAFWNEVRQLTFLQGSTNPVWRISTAPKSGPALIQAISGIAEVNVAYDWSGGLLWLEVPASADANAADIHRIVAIKGGQAMLFRADTATRSRVDVFQPLERGLMTLTKRLKDAFDPQAIFNPGRMYAAY